MSQIYNLGRIAWHGIDGYTDDRAERSGALPARGELKLLRALGSSLRLRLLLLHTVVFCVAASLVALVFWPIQESIWRAHYREDGLSIANLLIDPAREFFTSGRDEQLRDSIREVLDGNPKLVYLVLVDPTGKALVHSDREREQRVFDDPVGALASTTLIPLGQAYARDTGELIYDVSVPVLVGGEHRGALRVGTPMSIINSGPRATQIMLLVILAGSLVLAIILSKHILSITIFPLERLAESARRIASGDLEHKIVVSSSDEIGQLAAALNEMASTMRESLLQAEDRRVRLIALSQDTLAALIAALSYRDHETEGHSRRVVGYSLAIGRKMGLEEGALEDLGRGALLHDIGKIGIPDSILHKSDRLSEDEWRIMRRHPDLGFNMLADIDFLRSSLPVIRHHHERFDGKGYPAGLKGEAIPLGARIFSVADAYDAMTSDRPHRRALPHLAAVEEIKSQAGAQFDPVVVEAFLSLSNLELMAIRAESKQKAAD